MNTTFTSEKDPISSAGDIITPLMQGSLRPTTPHNTQRYDQRGLVETTYLSIPSPIEKKSADPELPLYLPANWAPFTHPEGQPYFLRSTSLRIVTEDNLYEPATRLKVEFWTKLIEARLEENQVPPSNTLEVFIKIDDDDCDYYIVDFDRQTIFWLTTVGTEELGISAAASQSHLDLALKGLFWSHVEFFPMHFGGLPRHNIDELIGVFSHGYADQMTSNESTFCYGKEDCKKLLGLLKIAREYPYDGYQTCLVARLWSMIYQHRFLTHFGQPLARLGRDQNIIYEVDDNRRTAAIVSIWSLGMAEHFSKSLDNIFVDHFVYADQWRPFVSACVQEWKDTLIFTSISLLFQIALSFIPGSQIVATMTALFFLSSIAASLLLILKHRMMDKFSAHSALHYLESVHSEKHQFHFVALVFSLPSVLHLWGTGLLLSNCIVSIYLHFGAIPAVLSGCFVAFGLISSYLVLSPASMPSLRSLRRVEVAEDDLV